MMKTPPTNMDNVIDSQDIIERIEELEAEIEEEGVDDSIAVEEHDAIAEELTALKELAKEGEGSPDWSFGEPLIRDSYFQEYAQELAEDCGVMNDNQGNWPNDCIDWEQAARELQQDYMLIEFDDVEYWIRA